MQKKMMNGITLLNAAKIIAKTGEQLEGMIEILENKLIKELTDDEKKIRVESSSVDQENSVGEWLLQTFLFNVALFVGRKTKPSGHIAIQIVLYNENEIEISGWEPSLYVMYEADDRAIEIGSFFLSEILEEGCTLDNNRLWRWDEGWGFVVPLVKLNSEEDLARQIVEPVKKLFNNIEAASAFPADSIAFHFEIDGDTLCVKEAE